MKVNNKFLEVLSHRVLVLDGAMGTNLQKQNLTPADFWDKDGCNELLVLSKPEAVTKVHDDFFKAGCDAVETNSFGSSRIVLGEYDLQDRVLELNKKSVELARKSADKFSTPEKPRFVIGSIGPGTKLPTLGHIQFDEMYSVFAEQAQGLLQGGCDAILVETCQDILQCKIAVIAVNETMSRLGIRVPIICQVTMETTGTMLLGTEMASALTTLEMLPIDVVGMNCATGPKEMVDHVRYLSQHARTYISVLPNAGLPENVGGHAVYKLTPQEMADYQERFVREFGVNLVGGCCGTTPEHLEAIAKRVGGLTAKKRVVEHIASCSSLYQSTSYVQQPAPMLIGERTNANGSRLFKKLLEQEDYDGIVNMGRESVKEGSHAIDVCVAYVGRNETRDMVEVLTRLNQQVTVPIVVDSTEVPVLEESLKYISGKAIINSINLEDGQERMEKVCPLAKRFGAGLIALTIDEAGMAKTREKKFEIAKRIYDLATEKYGIAAEDLLFDTLTFTLGSGDQEFRNAGIETIEAIRLIKEKLPQAKTVLGLSNISFGLSAESRVVLNSVFLHYAIEAGLDAAIVHAAKILPLFKIEEEARELSRRLVFNEWKENKDPLQEFIAYFAARSGQTKTEVKKEKAKSLEESLQNKIIDGSRDNLENELEQALQKYSPLDIINGPLMDGMKVVGELFGAGKMQLPFVLQSAEVMKRAVAFLEPHMEKNSSSEKGRMVLATVKGDVHDIGKNLVDIILTNNGYKVFNLGIKQPIENILQAAQEHKADIIGLSGLLVKSTLIMKENLEEMNNRGITIPVICGGAALTRRYVEEDLTNVYKGKVYYGQDAFSALTILEALKKGQDITPAVKPISKKVAAPKTDDDAAFKHSGVTGADDVPNPPFWGYKILKNITLPQIYPYINKTSLFKAQWQFKQAQMTNDEYARVLKETVEPLFEELKSRCIREKILEPRVIYGYYPCYSQGNDLVILDETRQKELTRFSFPRQKTAPYQCVADFFWSQDSARTDVVAFQAVTVGQRATEVEQELFKANKYAEYLYLHGIAVETAEALAEMVHSMVRRDWNVQSQDGNQVEDLFKQHYRGSRYSFGYPACPNLEDQSKLFKILPAEKIGLTLTEESQLVPEQSTTAIVLHHPKAKYFVV